QEELKIQRGNLQAKEALIEELRTLIQDEENIGRAFNQFNEIRERWNEVGDVPRDQYSRTQTEFSRLQETFYYNISIYKELADHDKKVNLKKKKELVAQVRALEKENNIQELDRAVKGLIKKWDDIGATFQHEWEVVKEEFWGEARKHIAKVNDHYEHQRAQMAENLEKKKALIKQVEDIAEKDRSKRKEWNNSTDKVLAIQEAWKKVGFSKENESVWKEFREACDRFFDAKKEFYKGQSEVYEARKGKKLELIKKAEELSASTDWKDTADQLINLQKDWKEIGPTFQKDENKLWKQFRSHCDSFFNARNRSFKEREKEEKENLKVKEDIIERIKAFTPSDAKAQNLETLKGFSQEWNQIGHVPFKQKDRIYKEYKEALDKHYKQLRLDDQEKRSIAMQHKLDSIKNDPRSVNREKQHIRRQIDKLAQDIKQYENNLGFFNDRSGKNPLMIEVEKKIDRNKKRIDELKQMLKMIDKASV
ncbi:MAG: DUF349 domain-containing protein, partial [Flavobacteriales bacterium]|nr:DUF349 domain-containing protein [Flavobacteriales bacterium]